MTIELNLEKEIPHACCAEDLRSSATAKENALDGLVPLLTGGVTTRQFVSRGGGETYRTDDAVGVIRKQ